MGKCAQVHAAAGDGGGAVGAFAEIDTGEFFEFAAGVKDNAMAIHGHVVDAVLHNHGGAKVVAAQALLPEDVAGFFALFGIVGRLNESGHAFVAPQKEQVAQDDGRGNVWHGGRAFEFISQMRLRNIALATGFDGNDVISAGS